MHTKNNNNKTKNFVQGLRPFSSSIPKTLKKHLRKNGFNYSQIVDNWTNLVSKKISDACYPSSIKMGMEMKNGTLVLNVIHGKELEVEYNKNEILAKINSFYGYDCVSKIKLKIVDIKIAFKEKKIKKIKNFLKINKKIEGVENNQLKKSLNNLIKAYNEKNK